MIYRPDPGLQGAWELAIRGLEPVPEGPEYELELACAGFGWVDDRPACAAGHLQLGRADEAPLLVTSFRLDSLADGSYRLALPHDEPWIELRARGLSNAATFEAQVDALDLGRVPAAWLEALGLDVLEGVVTAKLALVDGRLSGDLDLADGLLDGMQGLVAAEALDLGIRVQVDGFGDSPVLSLELEQRAGEILLGPVYLPPPDQPVALKLQLDWDRPAGALVADFDFNDPGSVLASGTAELIQTEQDWRVEALALSSLALSLPSFWQRWLEGPAAAAGFAGMETAGTIEGGLRWRDGRLEQIALDFHELSLDDPGGRLALYGLQANARGRDESTQLDVSWVAARLLGLPLGAARTEFHVDEIGLRMLRPLEIPLLDGAVVIDGLAWLDLPDLPSRLIADVRIEPVSLSLLTRQMGLLEFGGTLAGRFPGVEYQDEMLAFTGGMNIEAFSGRIRVDDLTVERPFGSLPALAAQLQFERLDLLELTGAFNFGRMEGQISGWARDLRLLDWRPVAMDARVFTHEDVRRRRISQRAVDNLSSLGGAGGDVISGTLLRVFEDFPYRRAGLACKLSNNICHIDGVAAHDSGGFVIVEGRGLPRLTVVGHRRLIDWPRLLQQLSAAVD